MVQDDDFGFKDLVVWQKAIEFAKHVLLSLENLSTDNKHFRLKE